MFSRLSIHTPVNLHERVMFSETSVLLCQCKKPEYIALFGFDEEIISYLDEKDSK